MPFIIENGVTREVTDEEYDAFRIANNMPIPKFGTATAPTLSNAGGLDINLVNSPMAKVNTNVFTVNTELQSEKRYLDDQKSKLADRQSRLIEYQDQLAAARASGASNSEIAAIQSKADTLTARIQNTEANINDSEKHVSYLNTKIGASDLPPRAEAFTNQQNEDYNALAASQQDTVENNINSDPIETNRSLTEGNTTVQTFDDGSTLQTFDDGSTLATDTDGNTSSSPATDGNPAYDPSARRESAKAELDAAKADLVAKQQASADAQERVVDAQLAVDEKQSALVSAQIELSDAESQAQEKQEALDALENDPESTVEELEAAQAELDTAIDEVLTATAAESDAQQELDDAESELETANEEAAIAASEVDDAQGVVDDAEAAYDETGFSSNQNEDPTNSNNLFNNKGDGNVPDPSVDGGEVVVTGTRPTRTSARWSGSNDMRVILRIPSLYLKSTLTEPLRNNGGILFPYTPTLSYDTSASYGNVNPTHSNYTQYFFKNSAVGQISLSGKFTVQNETEAKIWLSIVHLGRMLTKMRFGSDQYAGSAPPVCRLDGYGDMVLSNAPVSVTSFKFDLPEGVDYISVQGSPFGNSMVPTISTISFTLIPRYSRDEIRKFSVDEFLNGKLRGAGYL